MMGAFESRAHLVHIMRRRHPTSIRPPDRWNTLRNPLSRAPFQSSNLPQMGGPLSSAPGLDRNSPLLRGYSRAGRSHRGAAACRLVGAVSAQPSLLLLRPLRPCEPWRRWTASACRFRPTPAQDPCRPRNRPVPCATAAPEPRGRSSRCAGRNRPQVAALPGDRIRQVGHEPVMFGLPARP